MVNIEASTRQHSPILAVHRHSKGRYPMQLPPSCRAACITLQVHPSPRHTRHIFSHDPHWKRQGGRTGTETRASCYDDGRVLQRRVLRHVAWETHRGEWKVLKLLRSRICDKGLSVWRVDGVAKNGYAPPSFDGGGDACRCYVGCDGAMVYLVV
ncbi:hypothetical protein K439DRAFT_1628891 [Ramaria rubella]|nr:hypothetical protein K439DRAFT_1628891 [Ramaria rubella]